MNSRWLVEMTFTFRESIGFTTLGNFDCRKEPKVEVVQARTLSLYCIYYISRYDSHFSSLFLLHTSCITLLSIPSDYYNSTHCSITPCFTPYSLPINKMSDDEGVSPSHFPSFPTFFPLIAVRLGSADTCMVLMDIADRQNAVGEYDVSYPLHG